MTAQASQAGEDWPQFRGPNCRGISSETKSLPLHFSDTENVSWQQAVGDGVGGAVVAAGRVFVSGMTDSKTVSLFAFDLASGEKLWRRRLGRWRAPEVHL